MAKRFTDTELWDKDWFMELSPKIKLLIKFMFDKCDVAGVWSPNWTLASTYIGIKVSASDLVALKNHVEKLPDGKIWVTGFVDFQYGQLSENSPPHKKIIAALKKYGLFERVGLPYQYPTNTLPDRVQEEEEEKEQEKEKEEEKEQEKGVQGEKLVFPFSSENFMLMWQRWKTYKLEQHKFRYKSISTEQAALNQLTQLCKGFENVAVEIILQSIAQGWKGFFELNNNSQNGTRPSKSGQSGAANFKQQLAAKLNGNPSAPGNAGYGNSEGGERTP